MIAYYLDSSVAVRILFGHSPAAAAWFDTTTADSAGRVISSRLLRTELTRVLRREGRQVADRDLVLDHVDTIPVDHAVLGEAEAIVPQIRTLDAIHLASALRCGIDELVIATHDRTMATVAEEIGFGTHDPVTDDPALR